MIPTFDLDEAVAERFRVRWEALPAHERAMSPWPLDRDARSPGLTAPGMPEPLDAIRRASLPDDPVEVAIGLLFAKPTSETMGRLAGDRRYFDLRMGNAWDLFFPGYYEALEKQHPADRPLETATTDWWFDAEEFNRRREEVTKRSGGRWEYSGGADLLLVRAGMPSPGKAEIAWDSLVGGQLDGRDSRTDLNAAVESIMADVERGRVVELPRLEPDSRLLRDVASGTIAATIAQIMQALLGI